MKKKSFLWLVFIIILCSMHLPVFSHSDPAQIAELEKRLKKLPGDYDTLFSLGVLYHDKAAGGDKTAARKAVAYLDQAANKLNTDNWRGLSTWTDSTGSNFKWEMVITYRLTFYFYLQLVFFMLNSSLAPADFLSAFQPGSYSQYDRFTFPRDSLPLYLFDDTLLFAISSGLFNSFTLYVNLYDNWTLDFNPARVLYAPDESEYAYYMYNHVFKNNFSLELFILSEVPIALS